MSGVRTANSFMMAMAKANEICEMTNDANDLNDLNDLWTEISWRCALVSAYTFFFFHSGVIYLSAKSVYDLACRLALGRIWEDMVGCDGWFDLDALSRCCSVLYDHYIIIVPRWEVGVQGR